jgi:asparagine synthase (glutamine-hydrolysing)
VRTYSIGFDVPGYDEMGYARTAARHFGTDHHEYYVTPRDVIANITALAMQFDQPFGNSSALPAFCCARMARQGDVTTLLAGDGGDELFGGNSRYAKQLAFSLYDSIPASLRNAMLRPLAEYPLFGRVPGLRKAASFVQQAAVSMPDRMEMYNLLLRTGLDIVFDPAFLTQIDSKAPIAQQRRTYNGTTADALINRMLAYDWKYTLADNDLPKVVGAARLAGVGVEFPLLDDRLVEFSLNLAPSLKLRRFKLRWFFKEALSEFLPREILTKKKHGFGLPFGSWAVKHQGLREIVLDSLSTLKRRRIVRSDFVDDLVEQRLPAHPGYYGEMVWILMMLEQWLGANEASSNRAASPENVLTG